MSMKFFVNRMVNTPIFFFVSATLTVMKSTELTLSRTMISNISTPSSTEITAHWGQEN
jgi:hypothetical protein